MTPARSYEDYAKETVGYILMFFVMLVTTSFIANRFIISNNMLKLIIGGSMTDIEKLFDFLDNINNIIDRRNKLYWKKQIEITKSMFMLIN